MTYTLKHRTPYGLNGTTLMGDFESYLEALEEVVGISQDSPLVPIATPHAVAGIQADKPLQT